MMNRQNALAALWASTYSISLVLVVALCEALGVAPYWSVPFVIVILPFAVAVALVPFQLRKRGDGL